MQSQSLTLEPIGQLHNAKRTKFDLPSQPDEAVEEENIIELLPGKGFELALRDLAGFDRIWLIWWFDRNTRWKPLVLPPRSSREKRGVFATRSPHRPNPLGMSCVKLISVNKLKLTVGPVDLLDGTPILDIKPYIASYDSFPEASTGWLQAAPTLMDSPALYALCFEELAEKQLRWLAERNVNFMDRAREILTRDPHPHRTRRIVRNFDGRLRLSCGGWRVYYTINPELAAPEVVLSEITPGYSRKLLTQDDYSNIPDKAAQIEFLTVWGEQD